MPVVCGAGQHAAKLVGVFPCVIVMWVQGGDAPGHSPARRDLCNHYEGETGRRTSLGTRCILAPSYHDDAPEDIRRPYSRVSDRGKNNHTASVPGGEKRHRQPARLAPLGGLRSAHRSLSFYPAIPDKHLRSRSIDACHGGPDSIAITTHPIDLGNVNGVCTAPSRGS